MNQPLHNNAIPAHPGIAAQHKVAPATESAPPSAPIESSQRDDNAVALWDAFGETAQPPSAAPLAPPPVQVAPQPPEMPALPPEVPTSIDDLLSSGSSSPVQQAPEPVAPVQPVVEVPQPSAPALDMGALQKQAIDYLMANEYRLSDEDRTQLISAPDEVLPRLAARMHIGIATALAQQVAQAVPAMIQQHMETHVKAQRAEMEFFGRFPKLNREEWKPTIAESLQMVKQMNPQATREQIINEGAALAAFRIQSKFGNRHVPQPPQQPRGPVQPYVPVATGGGMSPPTNPNQQSNVWADLAMDPDFSPF